MWCLARQIVAVVLVAAAACVVSCRREQAGAGKTKPSPAYPADARTTEQTDHWERPTAPQGPAPAGWSALERSLLPKDCGTCHPAQLQDWSSALHSKAMGPGFVGQMIHNNDPSFTQGCYKCHAPLTEQLEQVGAGKGRWVKNSEYSAALNRAGVTCAVCHVRGWSVKGPPPKDGKPRDMSKIPHGGFVVDELFQSSKMCAACHQFPPTWRKIKGKLLEDTYNEWKASPAAAEGKTCQTCHMPDRRHLFRGIHDKEMTRSAFSFVAEARVDDTGAVVASAKLTNVGAGHKAPTYVTPRITIQFQQFDAAGQPVGKASKPTIIQWHVKLGGKDEGELFDTRLAPGKSIEARWNAPRHKDAVTVRALVHCIPDHYYEEFYRERLRKYYKKGGVPHRMLQQALKEAVARRFDVFDKRMPLAAEPTK